MAAMKLPPRAYRREAHYPFRLRATISEAQAADLAAAADKAGLSVSALVRQCIDKALPGIKSNLRPSRRRNRRPGDGAAADQA